MKDLDDDTSRQTTDSELIESHRSADYNSFGEREAYRSRGESREKCWGRVGCGRAPGGRRRRPTVYMEQERKHQQQMAKPPCNPTGLGFIESHRSADHLRCGGSGAYRSHGELRGNAAVAWAARAHLEDGGASRAGGASHRVCARRRRDPRPKQG